MNCLVTGASGFTGYWLSKRLVELGVRVVTIIAEDIEKSVFARTGLIHDVECKLGTVLDVSCLRQTIAEASIDSVFHLAAVAAEGKAHENPKAAFDVNVAGTYNVLEACRANSDIVRRIVVASSDKVYGDSTILPYTEDLPVQGLNPYDASKSCADLIARCYFRSYDLPVCVARFANIYGGADLTWSRLIPNTIRQLLRNEPPLIRTPPNDVYKRDFLYIDDQVDGYISLMNALALHRGDVMGESFNFGSGQCIPISEVVGKIQSLLGGEHIVPIWKPSEHREILHQQLSSRKAADLLGWAPINDLDEGLAKTVEWYTSNRDLWS
jgi:CDP-glucose 4,6-dehydratase